MQKRHAYVKLRTSLNDCDYWPILGESTKNLIIEGVMLNHDTPWSNILFIQRCYDNQELKFNLITIHPHPQQQQRHKKNSRKNKKKTAFAGRKRWSDNQWWGKERFKRYLSNFRSDIIKTELRILKLPNRAPARNKPYNNISYLTYLQ